jgi:hypothetical protein
MAVAASLGHSDVRGGDDDDDGGGGGLTWL